MKPLNQLAPSDIADMLKSISPRIWGMAGAGAVAFGLFVYFIVVPAWGTRGSVKREIEKIKGQMATTQNLLMKQPELVKNKANFLKLSQEVKARLYKPGESSLLLGVISRLAQESKVSVVSSNPKKFEGKFPAPFNAQYEANAYSFTVEGGYHDLAVFISKIENYEKVLRVQNYTIRPQEDTPAMHLAELDLTAVSTKADGGVHA